jgi:hypothetical protein
VILLGWVFRAIPVLIARLGNTFGWGSFEISIDTAEEMMVWLPRILGAGILFMFLCSAALWAVTHLILSKKLNIL